MSRERLENVLDQLGYCGIWCGSCVVGNAALMELAERYGDLVESHGLEHWGAADFDYAEFAKGLRSIAKLPVCAGCLNGGGRDDCAIRRCAVARDLPGCVDCHERAACPHTEILEHMRSGARSAGLVVVDSPEEREALAARRDAEFASRWWWRAVFGGDGSGD